VRQGLTDAYARLVAMKLFGERAIDYVRCASAQDRRYLLFNPVTKMKVTTEGERVIDGLWDVVAAKGFEKDTYFEQAAMDIRALPKLEGTVHVNMALVLKFLPSYLLNPAAPRELPEVPRRRDGTDDDFLFHQGPARGLGKIRFADWRTSYDAFAHVPNVAIFREQADGLVELVTNAAPDEDQAKDLDLLLALGELFTLVVYGQLILEQAALTGLDGDMEDLVDQSSTCWFVTSRRTRWTCTARPHRPRCNSCGRWRTSANQPPARAAMTGSGSRSAPCRAPTRCAPSVAGLWSSPVTSHQSPRSTARPGVHSEVTATSPAIQGRSPARPQSVGKILVPCSDTSSTKTARLVAMTRMMPAMTRAPRFCRLTPQIVASHSTIPTAPVTYRMPKSTFGSGWRPRGP